MSITVFLHVEYYFSAKAGSRACFTAEWLQLPEDPDQFGGGGHHKWTQTAEVFSVFKKFLFLFRTSFTQICFSLCFHSVCPVTLRSKQRVYSGLSGSSVMCSALDRPPQTTGLTCATMETRRPVARCSRSVPLHCKPSYLFRCLKKVMFCFSVWLL